VPRVAILSAEDYKRILDIATEHHYTFILIAITTGMRAGEIARLKWDDVHINERIVKLSGTETKSHRNRQIIIPQVLADHLATLKAVQGTSGTVIKANGRPIASIRKAWERIRKQAGFPNLRIHDLRHAYATTLRGAGVSIAEIKELLRSP
jgi:integrase